MDWMHADGKPVQKNQRSSQRAGLPWPSLIDHEMRQMRGVAFDRSPTFTDYKQEVWKADVGS